MALSPPKSRRILLSAERMGLLFASICDKWGDGGKSPKRYKGDNQDNTYEMVWWKGIHAQRKWHQVGKLMSNIQGNHPNVADTVGKVSTQLTSTLTTWIDNYRMEGSSNGWFSNWFNDYGCSTNLSAPRLMMLTNTENALSSSNTKAHDGIISFASQYSNVRFICQLYDQKTEDSICQYLVH